MSEWHLGGCISGERGAASSTLTEQVAEGHKGAKPSVQPFIMALTLPRGLPRPCRPPWPCWGCKLQPRNSGNTHWEAASLSAWPTHLPVTAIQRHHTAIPYPSAAPHAFIKFQLHQCRVFLTESGQGGTPLTSPGYPLCHEGLYHPFPSEDLWAGPARCTSWASSPADAAAGFSSAPTV